MPRRKKKATELPTDEVMKKLFPKPVRDEVAKTALSSRKRSTRRQSK
jgi:hypothetical protein